VAIDHEAKQGEINLGELIQAKPRMYDDSTLNAGRQAEKACWIANAQSIFPISSRR
jgi:hypothetical protein